MFLGTCTTKDVKADQCIATKATALKPVLASSPHGGRPLWQQAQLSAPPAQRTHDCSRECLGPGNPKRGCHRPTTTKQTFDCLSSLSIIIIRSERPHRNLRHPLSVPAVDLRLPAAPGVRWPFKVAQASLALYAPDIYPCSDHPVAICYTLPTRLFQFMVSISQTAEDETLDTPYSCRNLVECALPDAKLFSTVRSRAKLGERL